MRMTEKYFNSKEKMSLNSENLGWATLPVNTLLQILQNLTYTELLTASRVCKNWFLMAHSPALWRTVEFNLSQTNNTTSPRLIDYILHRHGSHLRYVFLKTDSSVESAEAACIILSKLMDCPLKMLELINVSKSSFFDIDCDRFTSALTIAFDRSPLRSLMIDHTPVDDPSLANLAFNTSSTLQHLRIRSCPRLSPEGILKLGNHCTYLRELSISYSVLSDELLMALSSKEHVRLEILRIEAHREGKSLPFVSDEAWQSLAKHSPNINITLLSYLAEVEDYESLFLYNFPVTNLYFGNYVPASVFMKIGKSCPRLVELIISSHGPDSIDEGLISVARGCSKLSIVGLGDCELTCSGLAEFVGLLGKSLRELYVWEMSLLDDAKCDTIKLIATVSSLLGRSWTPEYVPLW